MKNNKKKFEGSPPITKIRGVTSHTETHQQRYNNNTDHIIKKSD